MVCFPYRNYEEGTESSVTYYQFMDHGDMISCCGLMIHQTYGDEQIGRVFPKLLGIITFIVGIPINRP